MCTIKCKIWTKCHIFCINFTFYKLARLLIEKLMTTSNLNKDKYKLNSALSSFHNLRNKKKNQLSVKLVNDLN